MNTKEMIAVMQAFDEGGQIEYRDVPYKGQADQPWTPIQTPLWNWYLYEYRVKKEKVKVYCYQNKKTKEMYVSSMRPGENPRNDEYWSFLGEREVEI